MNRATPRNWSLLGLLGGTIAMVTTSCLSGDTRPVPGSVLLMVEASPATRAGLTTSDGWNLRFDRVLTSVGDARLQSFPDRRSTSCNDYSQARYERLFDFTRLNAPSKVGLVYGLGGCALEYRVRAPSSDALVEDGATSGDLAFMRTSGTDAFETDQRVSLHLEGRAERAGVLVRFTWDFRRGLQVANCPGLDATGTLDAFTLRAHDTHTLDAVVSPEELFRAAPDDDAAFVFDLVASGDANHDGIVTLEELASVPAPPSTLGQGGGGGSGGGPGSFPPPVTLADLVYDWLLPRVSRIKGGGPCEARPR